MWKRSIIGVDDTTDLIGTTRFHSFLLKTKDDSCESRGFKFTGFYRHFRFGNNSKLSAKKYINKNIFLPVLQSGTQFNVPTNLSQNDTFKNMYMIIRN